MNNEPRVAATGLTRLHGPQLADGEPVADIVFVHGLQGHPKETWTLHENAPDDKSRAKGLRGIFKRGRQGNPTTDNEAGSEVPATDEENAPAKKPPKKGHVFWPLTLLPNDCRQAQVWTWGYDTAVTKRYQATNHDSLFTHAQNLLAALERERQPRRPLIFVAHSLGGILVKEVLRRSMDSDDEHGSEFHDIIQSTKAVVFMGTPHRGSKEFKDFGENLRAIASGLLRMDSNPEILRALGMDSKELEVGRDAFIRFWRKFDFEVKTFTESEPLYGVNISIANKLVVPLESSILGDSREHAESLKANHISMCKFSGFDDEKYTQVGGWLKKRVERLAKAKAADCQACRESLDFPDMNFRFAHIEYPSQKTYQWIFSHERYIRWLDTDAASAHEGLLWIKGKPGTGKSTLMKHLFTTTAAMEAESNSVTAAFFFNRRGTTLESSPVGMARSLLSQLLDKYPAIGDDAFRDIHKRHTSSMSSAEWTKTELYHCLQRVLCNTKQPIIIFIDALDECPEPVARDVVQLFRTVTTAAYSAGKKVNVCLASRHYPNITTVKCPEISLESENTQDILTYIEFQLEAYVEQEGPEAETFVSHVAARSENIFLWAVCAVATLKPAADQGKSVDEMLRLLEGIPSDIYDLFGQILEANIEQGDRKEALLIWQWVSFATRPLDIPELRHAVGFSGGGSFFESGLYHRDEDERAACRSYRKRVLHLSLGLMEVVSWVGDVARKRVYTRVQFIHESVREFFLERGFALLEVENESQSLGNDGAGSSGVVERANSVLANGCMTVLEEYANIERRREVPKDRIKLRRSSFESYAWSNWWAHLQKTTDTNRAEYDLTRPFWHSKSSEKAKEEWFHGTSNGGALLFWAGKYDLPLLAQEVVGKTAWYQTIIPSLNPCNMRNDSRQTPLHLASVSGAEGMVAWLLDKGAAVDAQDRIGETPLHKVGTYDQKAMVSIISLLLQHNADPNIKDCHGRTPLVKYLHRPNALLLLIKYGADINYTYTFRPYPRFFEMQAKQDPGLLEAFRNWCFKDREPPVRKGKNYNDLERSPLTDARIKGYMEAADILEKAGGVDIRK